jgi:hypothetical protein
MDSLGLRFSRVCNVLYRCEKVHVDKTQGKHMYLLFYRAERTVVVEYSSNSLEEVTGQVARHSPQHQLCK